MLQVWRGTATGSDAGETVQNHHWRRMEAIVRQEERNAMADVLWEAVSKVRQV